MILSELSERCIDMRNGHVQSVPTPKDALLRLKHLVSKDDLN